MEVERYLKSLEDKSLEGRSWKMELGRGGGGGGGGGEGGMLRIPPRV